MHEPYDSDTPRLPLSESGRLVRFSTPEEIAAVLGSAQHVYDVIRAAVEEDKLRQQQAQDETA